MNGASNSGFCAPGPPAMTSVSSGPRSSAWSGDAAQVEHRQDVRVADLVLEREAQDVEPAQRREGLEAVERQPVLLAAPSSKSGSGVKARSQAQPAAFIRL